jgi:exodeoxyribonuclease V gamma subunit
MLRIHRSERADGLAEALGRLMEAPLADPMTPEVISVPTRGVERWVAQRLSLRLGTTRGRADGVCANVDFPFPGTLVGEAVAAATGIARDADPWTAGRSVWPLLEVVDTALGEDWLSTLAAHLGGRDPASDVLGRRARRFGAVRHIADLYDRYGVHRPGMLLRWAGGDDTGADGTALPTDARWQAELWRRLRARIAAPSPAERLTDAVAALSADPALADLPERLSLFGLTRLPSSQLEILRALAVHRDVHLFLLHPAPALWSRVAAETGNRGPVWRRAEDPTAALPHNPLLGSWGRDAREMQLVLTSAGGDVAEDHHPVAEDATTLLRRIQSDIRADRLPPGAPGGSGHLAVLDPDDSSVEVHACHGRARQVEVVRDAILHALADDTGLEPRDVIVMCPDIESFAPLIHATFGAGATGSDPSAPPEGGLPDLRVRLADRSLRQTNPVLGVVATLLDLAGARVTATQVLDLAGSEPVRRRFAFDDEDLDTLERWTKASGVRWGLDGAHRATFGVGDTEANTWRAGLDRVLLGVAMADEDQRLANGVLPLDEVGSRDIDLAGRLAEFVDRLHAALDSLTGSMPVDAWAATLAHAADGLTATGWYDAWQRIQLGHLLDEVVHEASGDGRPSAAPLQLGEIRALLADRLRGRPTRANFRTGHLTVCTLVPMRSVPHRVVCLLGLDDGVFPRRTSTDGDDILARDPRIGDRDATAEDRQLLLDALLAAKDRLIVTYSGNDERTNARLPPAVPVGELLDVVDRTVRIDGCDEPARTKVLVRHPLQSFDARNFLTGSLRGGRPWSFDRPNLEGARARRSVRVPARFLSAPLPPLDDAVIGLDDLVRFVKHPVKAFLKRRLRVSLGTSTDEPEDGWPLELDGLAEWAIGDRILQARLDEASGDAAAAERARGGLPPGVLSMRPLKDIEDAVEAVVGRVRAEVGDIDDPGTLDAVVELADGRRIVGTVPRITDDIFWAARYSKIQPKYRLEAWVQWLVLCAAYPDEPWSAVSVGRARRKTHRVTCATLRAPDGTVDLGAFASAHLETLIDLYDRGMREPLPLYCDTSAAYAESVLSRRKDPGADAQRQWESDRFHKEDRNAEHELVLSGIRTFDEIAAVEAGEEECAEGWALDEPSRFGRYALRLWSGLLACERVEDY